MKAFFRTLLAVIVGIILCNLLVLFILTGAMAGFVPQDDPIREHSVLSIDLSTRMADRVQGKPSSWIDYASGTFRKPLPLYGVLEAIRYAADDDNIAGIVIKADGLGMGIAMAEELRGELQAFKESGKFIYAYATEYGQATYYVASVADSVFVHPAGGMDWHGLSSQVLYYGKAFARFGIEPQIIRHGKFKSAVEPYMSSEMSPANREQLGKFLGSMWGQLSQAVAVSRGLSLNELNRLANEKMLLLPEEAVEARLVDQACYWDELDARLASRARSPEGKEARLVSLARYVEHAQVHQDIDLSAPKLAVLYAEGTIEDSDETDGKIGGDGYAKIISKLRRDSSIRAVVLRINSPGGSALASESMWRELVRLKAEKPLVVSMGDYAASGGYYIAAPADRIVSDNLTLTGSIGVFGLFITYGKLLREQIGIQPQVVRTHAHSDMGSAYRPLDEVERAAIQNTIESVYGTFISHVAQGRKLAVSEVDSVGQGRIWAGVDAMDIGLVDEMGGLRRAIDVAAQLAELSEYRVSSYPKRDISTMDKLVESILEEPTKAVMRALGPLGEMASWQRELEKLTKRQGVRAQMLYEVEIK